MDISHMKKKYENELAAVTSAYSAAEFPAVAKFNLDNFNFTTNEKKAALQAIIDKVIVKRIDKTRGRGSHPEINVQLKLKEKTSGPGA